MLKEVQVLLQLVKSIYPSIDPEKLLNQIEVNKVLFNLDEKKVTKELILVLKTLLHPRVIERYINKELPENQLTYRRCPITETITVLYDGDSEAAHLNLLFPFLQQVYNFYIHPVYLLSNMSENEIKTTFKHFVDDLAIFNLSKLEQDLAMAIDVVKDIGVKDIALFPCLDPLVIINKELLEPLLLLQRENAYLTSLFLSSANIAKNEYYICRKLREVVQYFCEIYVCNYGFLSKEDLFVIPQLGFIIFFENLVSGISKVWIYPPVDCLKPPIDLSAILDIPLGVKDRFGIFIKNSSISTNHFTVEILAPLPQVANYFDVKKWYSLLDKFVDLYISVVGLFLEGDRLVEAENVIRSAIERFVSQCLD